jgi:hypothetical protein
MSSSTLVRTHSLEDEAFFRTVIFCEEDRHRYVGKPYDGGFRWFRNPNIVPIEHWRRVRTDALRTAA